MRVSSIPWWSSTSERSGIVSPWPKLATASATVATTSCRQRGFWAVTAGESAIVASVTERDEGADYLPVGRG